MKLNPQLAPLYGKCVITVQLGAEELAEDDSGVEYFLLFAGSTQRHLTSTLRSSHDTLQALCPAHDCCEAVQVTLCSVRCPVLMAPEDQGTCLSHVAPVAEHCFCFVQDLAFDMAQFLVSTAGRANGLEGALLLDECHVPLQECERLDESLALALRHLKLPPEWSLLGKKLANSTVPPSVCHVVHDHKKADVNENLQDSAVSYLAEVEPQETLLHFAARRGLRRVADFLLQQSGALEALRLANKQGHTPASIAEERGHTELHQHLTQAEADTETERGTLTIQPFTTYARVVCHLPKLKTHTLTVGAHPGHEPPTLQRSVEQLRHLICHLHAKGVPSLDLQSESLHTAPECSEGVETETACSERLQHWSSTQIQGCEEEHSPEGSSSSTVEVGQPGNAEIRGCSPFSLQTSEQPEDDDFRLHHSPNTDRDYCETREERREEGAWEGRTELLVAFDRSVSLCDGASGTQGETEGKSPEVGTPLPPAKGKQTAETDKEESVICQWLGAPERTDRFSREGEESLAVGEEESGSGCRNPTVFSRDEPVSDMGNVQLSENSEVLDTSDSDMEKCSQDGESVQREEEEVQSKQDPCGNLCFTGEEQESKGLIDPTSSKLNLSNSSPTGCGDVRLEVMSESVGPRPTIEGLGEGEYSSDINKIEQNQETAGRDYPSEEQCNLADNHSHVAPESGGHSEDYSEKQEDTGVSSGIGLDVAESADVDEQAEVPRADIESTSLPLNEPDKLEQTCIDNTVDLQTAGNSIESTGADTVSFEPTEMMSSLGNGHTELDPGMTQQDVVQTKKGEVDLVGIQSAKTTGTGPNESNDTLMPEESRLPLEQSVDVLIVTDSGEACLTPPDTEPESQPSPSLGTMEALSPEGTGKRLSSDSSVGGLSLETLFAESEGAQVMETVEEYLGSEVDERVVFEHKQSLTEGSEVTDSVAGHALPTDTSVGAQVTPRNETGETDPTLMLRQLREDTSEMTAETDTNEGLSHVDIQICVTSSENMAPALHGVDVTQGAVPPPADNEASSQTPAEEVFPQKEETKPLKTPEPVDGASSFLIQEGSVLVSDDLTASMGQEADSQATREDATVIHRDKEASYPLSLSPCAQPDSVPSSLGRRQTGSSQSSALSGVSGSSVPSPAYRDSGSDTEGFLSAEPGDDCVFRKGDDPVTGGDSTSEVSISCSSTDDTASVGLSSSSPESCLERGQALGSSWSPEEVNRPGGAATAAPSVGGETEEEAKDRLTEVPRRSALLRSSIRSVSPLRRHSWGPGKNSGGRAEMNQRSYSLEGLSRDREGLRSPSSRMPFIREPANVVRQESEERGSLVSLTEEQEEFGEGGAADEKKSRRYRPLRHSCPPMTLPLTKSVSMLAISQRDIDVMNPLRRKRRISFSFNLSPILTKSKSQFLYGDSSSSDDDDHLSTRSFSSTSGSLAYSISEEEPGPLRSDTEGKSGTKVSRTFSYLKNKMYKKTREKEREKKAEKDRENKDKDKKTVNGHLFTAVCSVQANHCSQCNKALHTKDVFQCTYCNASVHKGCRDSLPICTKAKTKFSKHQFAVPDSSSYPVVTMRNKCSGTRERPWSAILSPEDHSSLGIPSSRRHTSIIALHGNNLSKSLSISNIAGPVFDDISIKGLRYLSQSTDSLNRTNQVTESMESLTDEGTEMMDGQLMGEFEAEVKELEADSWSFTVDQKYLGQLEKDLVKKQDVIYELMQTEMHHVRTLRIMSEVYSKGLQKEVQLEGQTVDRLFPALDDLLELHTQHLLRLLERKRESQQEGSDEGFVINRIGDILVSQFSGSSAESMKRIYGKFCSRHNEAVNFYKELLTKDKRFQAFIKRKMSSSIVRRLGIPECILLVTQRITKYPVLIQRMLQHTKEDEEDFEDLAEAVRLVKETIATVDSKVNEHEKKRRLNEVYSRTDSKSIMRMKSGQMFAREDLLRGRRLLHDGALQLKNAQGRLKDVLALLLSDVFVFLQEKDQKFVFASLDQRSTVLSLHKLIVREVANEERGLFLITAGIEKPEMVEVLASSKDERNTWMQLIEDAMNSIEKDEDEGIPSETEEDKRQLESKAREMRELLRQKDAQIMALLEEKVKVFKEMCECGGPCEEQTCAEKALFRAGSGQVLPRGEPIMKDALLEVETLQALVNGSLGGAMAVGQQVAGTQEGGEAGGEEGAAGGGWVGPVCLPRRAETFGGFDSHQMKSCKSGDKDEAEDTAADLRRTESDSVLKKGGNTNLLLLMKRKSEQVLHRVSHLHDLLSTLQAVVVQQDSFIEDQRQTLCERSSSISSSASSSRLSSRPNSLIEQEKQRSLEKQRQELASLQRQQAAHADERRRREKEWELREQQLTDREVLLHMQEEETERKRKELEEESQELQSRKEEYQRDLERLRDAQRKLERDRETLQRDMEKTEQHSLAERRMERTLSSASDDSQFPGSSASLERDPAERTSSLGKDSVSRSKPRGKSLNPFSSSSTSDSRNQIPGRLLQLAKNKDKDKKEKKKKKGKGGSAQTAEPQQHFAETPLDGEIFFC